ncbi:hypothetical protein [Bradyrhizobium sp. Cp5.3]|uniref:hypothetical protein n=1 Tax=Bradyrhizobium sp. Cp5.3 TaxID=443598 RepID=UPI0004280CAC|nr:hypothetical protein [Bradyrhizobium sp. Cp5.3]
MTSFFVVPPRRPPKPIKLYKLVNGLIWRVHCVVAVALAVEGPPTLVTDCAMKGLVDALRDAANRLERQMEQHSAERRAEKK